MTKTRNDKANNFATLKGSTMDCKNSTNNDREDEGNEELEKQNIEREDKEENLNINELKEHKPEEENSHNNNHIMENYGSNHPSQLMSRKSVRISNEEDSTVRYIIVYMINTIFI